MESTCKSKLFTAFNASRPLCEEGRRHRALGLAQRRDDSSKYQTSSSSCTCPDFTYRTIRCKHIIALVLRTLAQEDHS